MGEVLIVFKRIDNGESLVIPIDQIREFETTHSVGQILVNGILVSGEIENTLYNIYGTADKVNIL